MTSAIKGFNCGIRSAAVFQTIVDKLLFVYSCDEYRYLIHHFDDVG
jgi:hypothetical protein